jgi:hypothetical protein
MQTNQDALLSQLKDIHLPDSVSFWPIAWGWWVLFLLLALLIFGSSVWIFRYKKRNRYRKQALAAFDQLALTDISESLALNQLAGLIKRTLSASKKEEAYIALSSNSAFSEILRQTMTEEEVELLTQGRYQRLSTQSIPIEALAKNVRHWIKHHKL